MSISADKHFKKTQSGRSMIEMLGVLAIIGVLSVGGIAGYTKAMTKYKINKTIDQVTQLAQNIRAFYATQKNYASLGWDNKELLRKAHLVPDEMWTSGGGLENPFGGSVSIHAFNKYVNSDDRKAFVIWMYGVPEEACVELLTQDWGVGSSSGLIAVGAGTDAYDAALGGEGSSSGYYDGYWAGGSSGYSNSDLVTFASEGVMGLDKAAELCEYYHDHLMWKFY